MGSKSGKVLQALLDKALKKGVEISDPRLKPVREYFEKIEDRKRDDKRLEDEAKVRAHQRKAEVSQLDAIAKAVVSLETNIVSTIQTFFDKAVSKGVPPSDPRLAAVALWLENGEENARLGEEAREKERLEHAMAIAEAVKALGGGERGDIQAKFDDAIKKGVPDCHPRLKAVVEWLGK